MPPETGIEQRETRTFFPPEISFEYLRTEFAQAVLDKYGKSDDPLNAVLKRVTRGEEVQESLYEDEKYAAFRNNIEETTRDATELVEKKGLSGLRATLLIIERDLLKEKVRLPADMERDLAADPNFFQKMLEDILGRINISSCKFPSEVKGLIFSSFVNQILNSISADLTPYQALDLTKIDTGQKPIGYLFWRANKLVIDIKGNVGNKGFQSASFCQAAIKGNAGDDLGFSGKSLVIRTQSTVGKNCGDYNESSFYEIKENAGESFGVGSKKSCFRIEGQAAKNCGEGTQDCVFLVETGVKGDLGTNSLRSMYLVESDVEGGVLLGARESLAVIDGNIGGKHFWGERNTISVFGSVPEEIREIGEKTKNSNTYNLLSSDGSKEKHRRLKEEIQRRIFLQGKTLLAEIKPKLKKELIPKGIEPEKTDSNIWLRGEISTFLENQAAYLSGEKASLLCTYAGGLNCLNQGSDLGHFKSAEFQAKLSPLPSQTWSCLAEARFQCGDTKGGEYCLKMIAKDYNVPDSVYIQRAMAYAREGNAVRFHLILDHVSNYGKKDYIWEITIANTRKYEKSGIPFQWSEILRYHPWVGSLLLKISFIEMNPKEKENSVETMTKMENTDKDFINGFLKYELEELLKYELEEKERDSFISWLKTTEVYKRALCALTKALYAKGDPETANELLGNENEYLKQRAFVETQTDSYKKGGSQAHKNLLDTITSTRTIYLKLSDGERIKLLLCLAKAFYEINDQGSARQCISYLKARVGTRDSLVIAKAKVVYDFLTDTSF